MKLGTFVNAAAEIKLGCATADGQIVELSGFSDMKDLITRFEQEKAEIAAQIRAANIPYAEEQIQWKAPVLNPGKMIFIGLNYLEHAKESNMTPPAKPIFFAKFANSLAAHGEDIPITKETAECDYEAEFAVVIGKSARNVTPRQALDYVFGYTICNDLSARDLQLKEGSQWTRGKAIDKFAPMGPVIVTADEIGNPHRLSISCKVNGELRQKDKTSGLIFNVAQLISHLSLTMTLEPGDIISTGTPSGVAAGMKNPLWLKPGDLVEVEIEEIGVLVNRMVAEE